MAVEGLDVGKDPNSPTHSRTLFLQEDGTSISFYVRPGPTKRRLSTLILHGGGTLCRVQEPGAVALAQPGEPMAEASGEFISTQYITDCVEKNERLDLEKYRLGKAAAGKVAKVPENPKAGQSSQASGSPEPGSTRSVPLSGRIPFTDAEDTAILTYVKENAKSPSSITGTTIWKAMEKIALTQHSWQSMKDRYVKHLKGQEHKYLLGDSSVVPANEKLKRKAEETVAADGEPLKKKASAPAGPPQKEVPEPPAQGNGPTEGSIFQEANREFEETEVDDSTPDLDESLIKGGPDANASSENPGPGQKEVPEKAGAPEEEEEATSTATAVVEESLLQAEEGPSSPALSPPEVGAAIRAIQHLMEEFNLDLSTVTQAFLKNSGELASTCAFLRTGRRADGYPIWSRQDDVDLQGHDENDRNKLIQKFGAQNVARRIEFRNS
ncbi:telomeric repeat-binding factor 2-interacting protein 1 [Ornithorhynchus anatinus]|nr:telomeric repeat-binding factor 2-interacting protein 1 [Ornithorhynchus anatinus]XP_028930838.1 telomeric repeat-binding factor 2-interacting protein 1 [Ornithorhynchus anatinus]XP_028930839.1 telomeric repeat-binding factor 2-interacting protein 1 [Ornithorhynchus anatinus]